MNTPNIDAACPACVIHVEASPSGGRSSCVFDSDALVVMELQTDVALPQPSLIYSQYRENMLASLSCVPDNSLPARAAASSIQRLGSCSSDYKVSVKA